jgi:hypothetical protein
LLLLQFYMHDQPMANYMGARAGRGFDHRVNMAIALVTTGPKTIAGSRFQESLPLRWITVVPSSTKADRAF